MKKRIIIFIILPFIFLSLVLGIGELVQGAEFKVTDSGELQRALSSAATNGVDDTILLAEGIYAGNFSYISSESQALTIKAEMGLNPGQVILNGQNLSRVLLLKASNTNTNFTLEKISLQSGNAGSLDGGGVYIETMGNVEITGCFFTANKATNGGCIYVQSAKDIIIKSSVITDSMADSGAGVYIYKVKTVTLEDNNMTNNTISGKYGSPSAVYVQDTEAVTITGNNISRNASTKSYGGSIWFSSCGTMNVLENTITNNSGGDCAGVSIMSFKAPAIFNLKGNTIKNNSVSGSAAGFYINIGMKNSIITIEDNIITDNSAHDYGAGYIREESDNSTKVYFNNNVIKNNSATVYYGGFYICLGGTSSSIIFNHNEISGNMAKGGHSGGGILTAGSIALINNLITKNITQSGVAGGLYINAPTISLINNTISRNTATSQGGGLYISNGSGTLQAYNNIIWGNQAGGLGDDIFLSGTGTKTGYHNNYHDLEGLWSFTDPNTNFDLDPLFIDPEKEDFHLRAGSLCLNIGDSNAPDLPSEDLEGSPRIADQIVDLGAYEHSATQLHPADLNQDWVISTEEFTIYGAAWKNGEPWSQGPNPIPIDYATRAGYLLESGGAYHNAGGGKPACWVPQP